MKKGDHVRPTKEALTHLGALHNCGPYYAPLEWWNSPAYLSAWSLVEALWSGPSGQHVDGKREAYP